jgi:hypothetical protein
MGMLSALILPEQTYSTLNNKPMKVIFFVIGLAALFAVYSQKKIDLNVGPITNINLNVGYQVVANYHLNAWFLGVGYGVVTEESQEDGFRPNNGSFTTASYFARLGRRINLVGSYVQIIPYVGGNLFEFESLDEVARYITASMGVQFEYNLSPAFGIYVGAEWKDFNEDTKYYSPKVEDPWEITPSSSGNDFNQNNAHLMHTTRYGTMFFSIGGVITLVSKKKL